MYLGLFKRSLGLPRATKGPRGGCNSTGLLISFFDFLEDFSFFISCPSEIDPLPSLERAVLIKTRMIIHV